MDEASVALQQRLHELESLFDLLPVGVAIARDSECRDVIANPAFLRMLGLDPMTNPSKSGPEAARLPFRVMENGVEVASENLPLQRAARDGVSVNSLCHIVRDDGELVTLQGNTMPLTGPDGEPCGSVGVFVDVTEREHLIRELTAAQRRIKTLEGLLPICVHCNKIRDSNRWVQLEAYIRDHSDAEFTHTICPHCAGQYYPAYPDSDYDQTE
jgi:hypothetical protein